MIAFDDPRFLLALPLAALVALSGRRLRRRQLRLAAWARTASIVLLVLALAGPRLESAGRDVDVAFLLDASDSMGGTAVAEGQQWVAAALAAMGESDRAALALFGRDARLEYGVRGDPPRGAPAVVVDGTATDLGRALRLAQGVLGGEHRRRVVLLTDGRQTLGDVVAAAEELADAGISLDVVPLASAGRADVLVEEVVAPSRVRDGEAYEVTVVVRNTGAQAAEAVLVVTADGQTVERRGLTLAPGTGEITLPQVAERDGTVRYQARLESGASTIAANDTGLAAVRVEGPPRVLLYEHRAGDSADLAAALQSVDIPTDVLASDVQRLPSLDELLAYDSVVLVDVPVTALGEDGLVALDAYVRDAGRGLVAIGGDESFGVGGYDGTPLEDLLPVFARVTDPQRRPSVAEALVVDTSGSMAACHCADENFGGPVQSGGVNKTDIAREAIARAVDTLGQQDQIGVLAFNTDAEWVIPLQNLPDEAVVDDGLARLHPEGDTDIAPAVREAIEGLRDAEARLRHIVLFSDGFMSDYSGLEEVAREAADAGITLSVVGTGEGATDILRRMAAIGGGRFYPGRDLASIPDIIALEIEFAARPIITEGTFFPVVAGAAPVTEDLDASPPLAGYLATTPKPTARTLLAIGAERDPLLATWQAGLGTATAWTSDVVPRWSADWLTWEGFATFWSDVVRDTFPVSADAGFALTATAGADALRIAMTVDDSVPADVDATVTVTGPDGTRDEIVLDRVALDRFEATLPAAGEGVYAVSGRLSSGGETLHHDTTTAIRSYGAEYAATEADPRLLERAAAAAGGRLGPEPETAFAREGLAPGTSSRTLWPLLALLALILAPVDVGLRRLRLERADWARARDWVVARARHGGRRGPPPAAPRDDATDALFAAKARARGQPQPSHSAEESP